MSGIAAAPTVRLQLVADVPLGGETTCLDNASPLKNVGGTDCVANHEPRACIRAIIRPWRDYLPLGRSL